MFTTGPFVLLQCTKQTYTYSILLIVANIKNVSKSEFFLTPGAKTIKKNTNSTQNKSQTHRAKQYEVTSFLSTDCELSTDTCSKNVYSLGPRCMRGIDDLPKMQRT